MRFHALLMLSACGIGILGADAPAATPLALVRERVTVAATPDTVWKTIGNFSDFGWHPAVAHTEKVSGEGNRPETVRAIVLKDGVRVVEQLREQDDVRRMQRYTILDSPLPVTDYEASLRVEPAEGGRAIVVWEARFRPGESGASRVVADIFSAGLAHLKTLLEAPR